MNQQGQFSFAAIWGAIGVFFAILDALDVVQLGLLSLETTKCAQSLDSACLSDGISKMFLFAIDVMVGPLLLAANIINNFGFIGAIVGLGILYFAYGRNNK